MRKFTTKIVNLNIPKNKRIIAISDVHGHKIALEKLLDLVNFNSEDQLFLLGDYIERGIQNIDCLRYVMQLSKLPNVHPIIGNNDAFIAMAAANPNFFKPEMLIRNINEKISWYGTCTLKEMCDSLRLEINQPCQVPFCLEKIAEVYKNEIDFLYSLPTIINTKNFLFVHGGIPHMNFEELQNCDPTDFTKNDDFMNKDFSFEKFVVVGHWPTTLYKNNIDCSPQFDFATKILSIDGGCGVKNYGQINALIIPNESSNEFNFEKIDELKLLKATNSQTEKVHSLNIKWPNNQVEVLEKAEFVTKVFHFKTSQITIVPTSFIYEENGETRCEDFTNHKFNVEKGEELSVINYKENFGYLVKKGSTIGWYKPNK